MSSRPTVASALVTSGLLLLSAASAVQAEGGPFLSPSRFFYEQMQQRQPAAAATPQVHPAQPRFRPVTRAAGPRLPRSVAAAPAPRKTTLPTVAVFGDRLGQALARGLEDDAGDRLAVDTVTSEDAGLARVDFDDWLRSLAARLGKADRPAVSVVMLGSNDRQPLPDGTGTVEAFSSRWQALYRARIDAVAATFRGAHVPLIWVGLPSVHGDDASADFVRLNALFRDRATHDGATFIDCWEAFSDDAGSYSPIGPDVDGRTVKLRKADGFGFTRAGGRKLASFVEGDIKRLQGHPATVEPPPQTADITIDKAREFDSALDIDVNAQIQREAGLSSEAALSRAKPAEAPQPPAAGPVLSLTAAPVASNGQLATTMSPARAGLQATLVIKADGPEAQARPQPGRADDFSWPKP